MQDASGVEEAVRRAHRTMERLENLAESRGNTNTTVVKLDGAGTVWGAVAVGVALGASIACTAWVSATMGDIRDEQRQTSAFMSSVFQHVPELREMFQKAKESESVQRADTEPTPSPTAPASGNASEPSR